MVARRAQPQGVGRRPVDERIRGRIQGGGTRRGWGGNKLAGCGGGRVGRPGGPDARNERQRRHGRAGRTGLGRKRTDAIRPEAGSVHPEKKVFLLMYLIFNIILFIFIEHYSCFKYVKPIIV